MYIVKKNIYGDNLMRIFNNVKKGVSLVVILIFIIFASSFSTILYGFVQKAANTNVREHNRNQSYYLSESMAKILSNYIEDEENDIAKLCEELIDKGLVYSNKERIFKDANYNKFFTPANQISPDLNNGRIIVLLDTKQYDYYNDEGVLGVKLTNAEYINNLKNGKAKYFVFKVISEFGDGDKFKQTSELEVHVQNTAVFQTNKNDWLTDTAVYVVSNLLMEQSTQIKSNGLNALETEIRNKSYLNILGGQDSILGNVIVDTTVPQSVVSKLDKFILNGKVLKKDVDKNYQVVDFLSKEIEAITDDYYTKKRGKTIRYTAGGTWFNGHSELVASHFKDSHDRDYIVESATESSNGLWCERRGPNERKGVLLEPSTVFKNDIEEIKKYLSDPNNLSKIPYYRSIKANLSASLQTTEKDVIFETVDSSVHFLILDDFLFTGSESPLEIRGPGKVCMIVKNSFKMTSNKAWGSVFIPVKNNNVNNREYNKLVIYYSGVTPLVITGPYVLNMSIYSELADIVITLKSEGRMLNELYGSYVSGKDLFIRAMSRGIDKSGIRGYGYFAAPDGAFELGEGVFIQGNVFADSLIMRKNSKIDYASVQRDDLASAVKKETKNYKVVYIKGKNYE